MRPRGNEGQATVEWLGLVLLVALALAGALAIWRGREAEGGRRLGAALAERITCAVESGCASATGPRLAPLRQGVKGPPLRPPRRAPAARAEPRRREGAGTKALRRARRLGGAAAKRAWLVCLGYERWRLELERPRPTEALPLDDALGIANSCLNPYEFLTGN